MARKTIHKAKRSEEVDSSKEEIRNTEDKDHFEANGFLFGLRINSKDKDATKEGEGIDEDRY